MAPILEVNFLFISTDISENLCVNSLKPWTKPTSYEVSHDYKKIWFGIKK